MRFELDENLVRDFLEWSRTLHLCNSGQHPCDLMSVAMERQMPSEEGGRNMRVFQMGPDEIDYDQFDFDWLVYWYETGSYDGSGVAAYKRGDKFGWANIGH